MLTIAPTGVEQSLYAHDINGYHSDWCEPSWLRSIGVDRMLVPDAVRKSVVFLGEKKDGKFIPIGTAFVMSINEGGFLFFHLVTAEHVIVGRSDPLYMRINLVEGGYDEQPIHFKYWWYHPDPDVKTDIAVLPTNIDRDKYVFSPIPIKNIATDSEIKKHDIGVGDETFIVGLFRSHFGQGKNLPIVRTGNIALMPEEPVLTGYAGYVDAYLVEARSIAGLSGSPVWVHMPPVRVVKGEVELYEGQQYYLLGVMQGRFNVKVEDEDVVTETDGDKDDRINSGIGVVLPAQRVKEIIKQPDLVSWRKDIVAKKREAEGADSQAVIPDQLEPPTRDENPRGREDFNSLLDAAVSGNKSSPGK